MSTNPEEELPKKTGLSTTQWPNVPIVHSLHTNALIKDGWTREGSTYTKGENTIVYNGYQWRLNGKEAIQFLEDIPQDKKE